MSSQVASVTEKTHIKPFIFMVILMALIGFVTGMNQQFQVPLKNTFLAEADNAKNTLSNLLNFVFFSAYLIMGPVAARFLNHRGYKKSLLVGILCVAGAMLVFEASVLIYTYAEGTTWHAINHLFLFSINIPLSFFVFLLGSFLSGTGLTYLQASVNPYLVVCKVPGTTGVTRQNIGGVGNSVMTTFTPFFVAYVIFGGHTVESLSVEAMIIPFAMLFIVLLCLYFAVYIVKLPHLEGTTDQSNKHLKDTVLQYRHLILGTLALGIYVGCEVCIGANLVTAWEDSFRKAHPLAPDFLLKREYAAAALWSTLYWGAMLVGRFCSSFLSKVSAQRQLALSTSLAIMAIIISMLIKDLRVLVAVGLVHSVMWGAIFSLALEGLGKYTVDGAGVLLTGLVGGAIFPLLQGIWADAADTWHYSWLLVLAGELFLLYYALYGHKIIPPKKDLLQKPAA